MQIKGSNAEIQDPFPFGTCFYFSAVAANQNFHLLSFCSGQVNLSSGARSTVVSAKKCTDEARLRGHSAPQDVHAAETELNQAAAESILDDTQKLVFFFISLKRQNRLLKFKVRFCFYTTCTLIKIIMLSVISCLSLLPPLPRGLQQDSLYLNLSLQKIL